LTRAVFCDRDGTLIRDADYPSAPEQVELLPDAAAALAALKGRGFRLVVISNQSGVGRGLISRQAFEAVHGRFVELLGAEGVTLDGAYYCLHAPAEGCGCRKPKPGLVMRAARELGIDAALSYMVGDKPSDIAAGRSAGLKTVFFGAGAVTTDDGVVPDAAIASWREAPQILV
jgi:D-glycero-D-manno-heptose 1,7-bisphosphate phosphatase